jgi:hypothetical protein
VGARALGVVEMGWVVAEKGLVVGVKGLVVGVKVEVAQVVSVVAVVGSCLSATSVSPRSTQANYNLADCGPSKLPCRCMAAA